MSMGYVRKSFDEMSTGFAGALKYLRKDMGISSFGCHVIDIPPELEGPEHDESKTGQEELYIGLGGSGWIVVDGEKVAIGPRVAICVPPGTPRKMSSGPDGVSVLAIGGIPGKPYEVPEFFRD